MEKIVLIDIGILNGLEYAKDLMYAEDEIDAYFGSKAIKKTYALENSVDPMVFWEFTDRSVQNEAGYRSFRSYISSIAGKYPNLRFLLRELEPDYGFINFIHFGDGWEKTDEIFTLIDGEVIR